MQFIYFFHSSLFPCSWSVNSIAYRRVIRVYQYEVDDDLSGRFSFHFNFLISPTCLLTPTWSGFRPHALKPKPTIWVFSTNPHWDVAMRQVDRLFSFLILHSLAPLQHWDTVHLLLLVGGVLIDSGLETANVIFFFFTNAYIYCDSFWTI